MMTKMMDSIIGRMSIEKKQEMMLQMMPMMMKDVNMAETMLKMMPAMLDNISVLDLFTVIKAAFPQLLQGVNSLADLIQKMDAIKPKMMEKMPGMMEKVMPMVMGKLMPMMMTEEHMAKMEKMPPKMFPKMMENEKLRELMPEMMMKMMPHCLEQVLTVVEGDKKDTFVTKMTTILAGNEG